MGQVIDLLATVGMAFLVVTGFLVILSILRGFWRGIRGRRSLEQTAKENDVSDHEHFEIGELHERMIFTPAERMVMIENVERLRQAANSLEEALKAADNKALSTAWIEMGMPVEQMNHLLNGKAQQAILALKRERGL